MATFEEQQKTMSRDIAEIKQSVKDTNSYIQAMVVVNDSKYAPMSTYNTVNWAIWVVLTAVILSVITLIMKKKT